MSSQYRNNQFSFTSNCNYTMTDIARKDKNVVQANSLSVKLLNSIGGSNLAPSAGKSRITSLKDLSNRIKLANQSFKNTEQKRQTIKQELLDEGIDLDKQKIQVAQIKTFLEKRERHIPKAPREQPIGLEINLRQLEYQQFAHASQQNAAYRAVFESLTINRYNKDSTQRNESRLKQIKFINVNRMKNIKEPHSPKSKSKENTERIKQYKLDINQLISKFSRCIDTANVKQVDLQLYKQYLNNQSLNDKLTSRWLTVLYFQIEMLNKINPATQLKLRSDKKHVNYLSVTSIQALNQVFSNMYKDKIDAFQHDYFIENRVIKSQPTNWFQLYFLLRSDKNEEFIQQLKQQNLEMSQIFENILDKLDNFQRPEDHLNTLGINQKNNHFQRILKLIILGKHQNIFKEVSPKLRALQQPWFILMALSLSRQRQSQQATRIKSLKQALSDYYNSLINNALKVPFDLEFIINFVTGLVSLGNYKLLFSLYDELKDQTNIQNHQVYLDFVHIFLIILANPNLIYCQTKVGQASEIMKKGLTEIVNYLKFLKTKKSEHFKTYFTLLLQLLTSLSNSNLNLPLQSIIESICSSLIVKLDDLNLISKQDLYFFKQDNSIIKYLQNNIIKHIHPQNQLQYIQLAQFCDSIDQQYLQESILVKLIIFNYFEAQTIRSNLQNGIFLNQEVRLNEVMHSRNIQIAEEYLGKTMQQGQKDILKFIKTLKKLRSYVTMRRKDLIRNDIEEITKYRSSNHRIFNYLKKIDQTNKSGLFQIVLSYYENLNQMYKLIHLSSSSLDKYEEQRTYLLRELKSLKDTYPSIESSHYYTLLQSLQK